MKMDPQELEGGGVMGLYIITLFYYDVQTLLKNAFCFCRRGPNKYTRNWEDEDAYNKPPVIKKGPKKARSRVSNSSDGESQQGGRSESLNEEIINSPTNTPNGRPQINK